MDFSFFLQFLPMVLFAISFASLLLGVSVGAVISYHWYKFAMNPSLSLVVTVVYGAGAFVCIALMFRIAFLV